MFPFMLGVALAASNTVPAVAVDLGSGMSVSVTSEWRVSSVRNPAMSFPELAKYLVDAREIRIVKDNTFAMATVSQWRPVKGKPSPATQDFNDTFHDVFAHFGRQAVETSVQPTIVANGDVRVGWMRSEERRVGKGSSVRGL